MRTSDAISQVSILDCNVLAHYNVIHHNGAARLLLLNCVIFFRYFSGQKYVNGFIPPNTTCVFHLHRMSPLKSYVERANLSDQVKKSSVAANPDSFKKINLHLYFSKYLEKKIF